MLLGRAAAARSCVAARLASGSPRLRLPRHQRRLRRPVHRPSAVLPRGECRTCPGRSGATSSTSRRWWVGARSTAHSWRFRRRRPTRSTAASPPLVAERIPNGAAIQAGIGLDPERGLVRSCDGHRDLGIHTELLSDGLIDLVGRRRHGRAQGAPTGQGRDDVRPGHAAAVRLPRTRTRSSSCCLSTGSTILASSASSQLRVDQRHDEVDLLGQCASETIAGHYWSGSRGPGRLRSRGDVSPRAARASSSCRSTAAAGRSAGSSPRLRSGSAVTTLKNTVDKVVTEHGVAELHGRTVRERTHALVAIADPAFRDHLEAEASSTPAGGDRGYRAAEIASERRARAALLFFIGLSSQA